MEVKLLVHQFHHQMDIERQPLASCNQQYEQSSAETYESPCVCVGSSLEWAGRAPPIGLHTHTHRLTLKGDQNRSCPGLLRDVGPTVDKSPMLAMWGDLWERVLAAVRVAPQIVVSVRSH